MKKKIDEIMMDMDEFLLGLLLGITVSFLIAFLGVFIAININESKIPLSTKDFDEVIINGEHISVKDIRDYKVYNNSIVIITKDYKTYSTDDSIIFKFKNE